MTPEMHGFCFGLGLLAAAGLVVLTILIASLTVSFVTMVTSEAWERISDWVYDRMHYPRIR